MTLEVRIQPSQARQVKGALVHLSSPSSQGTVSVPRYGDNGGRRNSQTEKAFRIQHGHQEATHSSCIFILHFLKYQQVTHLNGLLILAFFLFHFLSVLCLLFYQFQVLPLLRVASYS